MMRIESKLADVDLGYGPVAQLVEPDILAGRNRRSSDPTSATVNVASDPNLLGRYWSPRNLLFVEDRSFG